MIPNELIKSDSEYEVLNGTSDPRTGVAYPPANCSATSIPSLLVHVNRQAERINAILAAIAQGRVVQEASLTVGIWPITYRLNGVSKDYNGASNESVTDDATNYIYLDVDNALVINTTGFPADPATFLPLAEVTCENGSISEIVDRRPWVLYSVAEAGGTGPGAGDGLISSGGNYHVGAGNGIQANADNVAVKLDTTPGLEFNAGSLRAKADEVSLERVTAGLQIKNSGVTSLKLADNAVTTAKVADSQITEAKLASNAVTTAKIADAQVTNSKLATDAVTTAKVADSQITTVKIADGAVTGAKLGNSSVDSSKIATLSVGTTHLVNGAVTADKLAAGSVTAAKLGTDLAGNGLVQNTTTSVIDLNLHDTSGLEITSDQLRVKCGSGMKINTSTKQLMIDVDAASGYGIKNDTTDKFTIKLYEPSGLSLNSYGLRVNAGDGFTINNSTYALDIAVSEIIGTGLKNDGSNNIAINLYEPSGLTSDNYGLRVKKGDGIDINTSTYAVYVNVNDLVGSGLKNDGSNNLALNLYTYGGLELSDSQLKVKTGTGIQIDGSTGELKPRASDIAGAGLADDGSNKLKVNISTAGGLEFSGTNLQVKSGSGIQVDGSTGQVKVYLDSTPGLEFNGSTLRVKSDEATIERTAGGLQLKNSGITPLKLSDSIADLIPKITLSVGAELSNQISIGIQVKDAQDNSNYNRYLVRAWLSDYQYGPETSTTPDSTSWTSGVVLTTETANEHWRVITDTSGYACLRITEDNARYWYLNVEIDGRIYASDAISFA